MELNQDAVMQHHSVGAGENDELLQRGPAESINTGQLSAFGINDTGALPHQDADAGDALRMRRDDDHEGTPEVRLEAAQQLSELPLIGKLDIIDFALISSRNYVVELAGCNSPPRYCSAFDGLMVAVYAVRSTATYF